MMVRYRNYSKEEKMITDFNVIELLSLHEQVSLKYVEAIYKLLSTDETNQTQLKRQNHAQKVTRPQKPL